MTAFAPPLNSDPDALGPLASNLEWRADANKEYIERLSRGINTSEDASLGALVRPSDSEEPFQRWFRYREGYTVELCRRFIGPTESFILDPFCGFGSTLVAARELGLPAAGLDVSPLAAFVSRVKTRSYSSALISQLTSARRRILALKSLAPMAEPPPLRILGKMFHPEILSALMVYRAAIDGVTESAVREFLLLAWLAVLEAVSNVYREGNGIKYRNRIRRGNVYSTMPYDEWQAKRFPEDKFAFVRDALATQLAGMLQDVSEARRTSKVEVIQADARSAVAHVPKGGASIALFSPPYCNCFNYIKAYKLELWMGGFIRNYPDIRRLTAMGVRSRVESLTQGVREPYPVYVEELASLVSSGVLWSHALPDVVRGYFADMQASLIALRGALKRRGKCVVVVGNSAYAGVLVPTDIVLCRIAETVGFDVTSLIVTRHLTTSSQQRHQLTSVKNYLRESVIVLERR